MHSCMIQLCRAIKLVDKIRCDIGLINSLTKRPRWWYHKYHSVVVQAAVYDYTYYPRGASDARVLAVIVCLTVSLCLSLCLSVCLSVTRRYCIKTAKRMITQTTPRDSQGILVFWRQESLVNDPTPLPLKLALKVTHRLSNTTISTNIRSAPQPWKLAKKFN